MRNFYFIRKNQKSSKKPYCAFTNGVTRTIWLLANGAESFPVMTDKSSYELLKSCAGVENTNQMINNAILGTTFQ